MAFDGSGTFDRIHNWVADRDADIAITASRMDTEDDGFATGLSNCITKDGQTLPTANLPMNSKKLTGLAAGSANGDSVRYEQVALLSESNTFTGNIAVGDGSGSPNVFIDGVAGGTSDIDFQTGTANRWTVRRDATAESGSDAGSDFRLLAWDDAGTGSTEVFKVTRSTGVMNFSVAPTISGAAIYTVGGTDVPVTDGGTGASSAADARTNLAVPGLTTTNDFTNTAQWGTFSETGASAGLYVNATGLNRIDSSTTLTSSVSLYRLYNPNGLVGSISVTGTSTAYNTTSDAALKDAVVDAAPMAIAAKIKAGRPVEFEFKTEPGVKHLGFLAQEMAGVFPDAVTPPSEPGEPWMMDHSKLVPPLWAMVKDLLARVEALESA